MHEPEQVQFELYKSADEYRRGCTLARKHRLTSPLKRAVVSGLVGGVVAVAFAYFDGASLFSAGPLIFFAFVSSFSFAGSYVGEAVTWRHGVRRGEKELATLESRPALTVNRDGLPMVHDQGAVELKWHAVKRVVEVEGFLLMYITPEIVYYVPKTSVASGDWTNIVGWIEGAGLSVVSA